MTTARGGRSFLGHSRQWMVPVLLFVLALPAITPRLYASDEVGYFANLRSLWFDHDVSFDNEYRYFYDRGIAVAWTFYESYLVRETATGLRYSYWTVGPAILWSPFYAVADVTTRIRRAFGSEVPADGYSRPYLRAVTLGSAFYGFLAICLAIVTARRLVGEAHPAGSPSGSARRCSTTCTSRPASATRAARSRRRCSSRSGSACARRGRSAA